MLVTK